MPVIDATKIRSKLYQGSRPPVGLSLFHAGFDVLVLCAAELQLSEHDFPGIECQYLPLEDDPSRPVDLPTWHEVLRMGDRIAHRIRSGKRVLVTCAAGLNRSGLVTASALHFLTGASGAEAANYIQRRRVVGGQAALFNGAFVRALCSRLPARNGALPLGM